MYCCRTFDKFFKYIWKQDCIFVEYNDMQLSLIHIFFAHNEDIEPLTQYLKKIKKIPIDAFIVSDPGIISIIKDVIPEAELHLSTQANMTNYATANFWYRQGVRRLVLARELTLSLIHI